MNNSTFNFTQQDKYVSAVYTSHKNAKFTIKASNSTSVSLSPAAPVGTMRIVTGVTVYNATSGGQNISQVGLVAVTTGSVSTEVAPSIRISNGGTKDAILGADMWIATLTFHN